MDLAALKSGTDLRGVAIAGKDPVTLTDEAAAAAAAWAASAPSAGANSGTMMRGFSGFSGSIGGSFPGRVVWLYCSTI